MGSTPSPASSVSTKLLELLRDYQRVVVVMHDNPDPDAIASGWAVKVLIDERLRKPTRVVGGGAIVRAENRYMVELLEPPIELVDDIEFDEHTATVLVDCGVGANNHILTRRKIDPVAIIDHHMTIDSPVRPRFVDIRVDVAASATITASYLREQNIDPGPKLATAILYAVRTETTAYESHYSSLDRSILPWLMEFGDAELLAEIQNAPLRPSYYGDLLMALQNTFLYDDVAVCFLPRADGAEIVGEVADLLVRGDTIHRVLCGAVINGELLVSARTQHASDNAADLIQGTLDGLGGAGGHAHRAGGKISGIASGTKAIETLCDELRGRWLDACKVPRKRGTRLIAKREIVQNLVR
ncbi:DHH family phosphoesterase [Novipirellula artificiosorum]|uniref:Putative manganese-dependent inorganic pyrophosphatase n=1 Tax=Novipirellula artificiosorum TaxID=2528016 RepID=A0A5C6D350_9BACT|nr:DHH family phosphoesterase [Novipirellula artificiosorum]TWU31362.1 putative manganese-dependent inorganic pyrophosphatase [Novipirellula artificiosorum]